MDPLEEAPWADTPQSSATTSQQEESHAASATSKSTAASSSGARPSRSTPRRLVAQPTRLQAVEDDPLGPLGPLGGTGGPLATDSPPAPPLKEQLPLRTTLAPQQAAAPRRAPAGPHHVGDDDDDDDDDGGLDGTARGPRVPPPVPPAQISPVRTSSRPSVSVEQAAKPGFVITVGDPHTVADMPGRSHTEYMVHTKVGLLGGPRLPSHSADRRLPPGLLRQPPRRTSSPSSSSRDGIATSCGFTTRCMPIARASWFLRHPTSRPWVASRAASSSPAARRSRRC